MSLLNKVAPDFTLQNGNFEEISLSKYKGDKHVVLLFYPLSFSGVCTEELCSTRDNMKIYESLNAEVLAISVDSLFVQKAFKQAQNLNFEVLSDFNKIVSKEYGVLYDEFFGMHGVAKRSAFVIDKNGTVVYEEVLEDSSQIPSFDNIQNVLAGL
jgi:peroxiredoxin